MPYPNEHSARLEDPGKFVSDSFRRKANGTIFGDTKVPATVDVIWGKHKGKSGPNDPVHPQALRFPVKDWTAAAARKWLKDNKIKYIRFEPASEGKAMDAESKAAERRFATGEVAVEAETRASDGSEKPVIRGIAAVYYDGTEATEFQLWTDTYERIMPGSFTRAIAEDDVRGLFNHMSSAVLGRTRAKTMSLKDEAKGLAYKIWPPDTQWGRDTVTSIQRGDVTGSSFAFLVTDEVWRKETPPGSKRTKNIREILGVELFDAGPVTYPAYPTTSAGARAERYALARRSYEAWTAGDEAVARHRRSVALAVDVMRRRHELEI